MPLELWETALFILLLSQQVQTSMNSISIKCGNLHNINACYCVQLYKLHCNIKNTCMMKSLSFTTEVQHAMANAY